MGVTLPTIGMSAWGDDLNNVLEDFQDTGIIANDGGFLAWNYPSFHISTVHSMTSGTIKMSRLPRFAQAKTVNSVWFHIGNPAVTPTAGQCFAALFDAVTGTRVAVTADISGQLGTAGLIGYTLTSPYAAALGADLYSAILQNAATPATLGSCSSQGSTSAANASLSAASGLFTDGPTAQTSMPASVTLGSRTLSGQPLWTGVK